MMEKKLGRIRDVRFGIGGYDDRQFGLSISFGGDSWGVSTFRGVFYGERTERTQWTEADREREMIATMWLVHKTLEDAKVKSVADLLGVPVELTFLGKVIHDWRILTEVL